MSERRPPMGAASGPPPDAPAARQERPRAPAASAPGIDPAAIREFASRPWTAAERARREHWARAYRDHGSDATLAASLALWRHMRAVRPDWPTARDRQEDLEHHVALKRAIDRAARVVAGLPAR